MGGKKGLKSEASINHAIVAQGILHHSIELRVFSGIAELDRLLKGFPAQTITYLDGDQQFISKIMNQLCVHTYRNFHSNTLIIDAGSCIDPYQVARYACQMETSTQETLQNTLITRAVTIYQIQHFVLYDLEQHLNTYETRTILIGGLPTLFCDHDLPPQERTRILQNILQKLQTLTRHYDLVTLLTGRSMRQNSAQLRRQIESYCTETLRIKTIDTCTYIDAVKQKKGTVILHLGKGQLRLEHFGLVVS